MTDAEIQQIADAVIKTAAERAIVACVIVGLALAAILHVGNWLGKIK